MDHTWECQQACQKWVECGWGLVSDMEDDVQESKPTWKEIRIPDYIFKVESYTRNSVPYQVNMHRQILPLLKNLS
jgi:hypothetical protein